eukprot:CAMPEP_0114521050 /NCGR_PEP_ID=MMETSP0109-20121206/19967_1 /TAXON_ID=29199 /ORGANISM="Chlorarachnion reptans, Strain CCCM449" /LENGTH=421 /DNA_ID=CAMNT_0001702105 /DNA_START=281 /DNA_END=1547 /DNA_ORIENTATION=-
MVGKRQSKRSSSEDGDLDRGEAVVRRRSPDEKSSLFIHVSTGDDQSRATSEYFDTDDDDGDSRGRRRRNLHGSGSYTYESCEQHAEIKSSGHGLEQLGDNEQPRELVGGGGGGHLQSQAAGGPFLTVFIFTALATVILAFALYHVFPPKLTTNRSYHYHPPTRNHGGVGPPPPPPHGKSDPHKHLSDLPPNIHNHTSPSPPPGGQKNEHSSDRPGKDSSRPKDGHSKENQKAVQTHQHMDDEYNFVNAPYNATLLIFENGGFARPLCAIILSPKGGEKLARKAVVLRLRAQHKPGELYSASGTEIRKVHKFAFQTVTEIQRHASNTLRLNISANEAAVAIAFYVEPGQRFVHPSRLPDITPYIKISESHAKRSPQRNVGDDFHSSRHSVTRVKNAYDEILRLNWKQNGFITEGYSTAGKNS